MSHTIAVDMGSTHIRVAHQRTRSRASQPGVYQRFARAIESIAVPNFLVIFDPSILIFGGVSQVGERLFKSLEESLRKHAFHPRFLDHLVIPKAALGDDAGLLGALALARMKSV